jgi:hypothetical protein
VVCGTSKESLIHSSDSSYFMKMNECLINAIKIKDLGLSSL